MANQDHIEQKWSTEPQRDLSSRSCDLCSRYLQPDERLNRLGGWDDLVCDQCLIKFENWLEEQNNPNRE